MAAVLAQNRDRNFWNSTGQRFLRHRAASISLALLIGMVLLAIVGPHVGRFTPEYIDWDYLPGPPSLAHGHWFGTDATGRDLFVRTMIGLRVSLLVGLAATLVSFIIGVSWGATAGYLGGHVDDAMMRFVDVLYSLPYLFFVIVLTVFFGSNIYLMFVALGAVGWLTMARIVRGQTLALRHREFIAAAILAGVPTWRIIWRHIVPNVLGPAIVYAALTVPQVILNESFLSFLGLGVQEPLTSLGRLVAEGSAEMESSPWMLLIPASFLAGLLLCLNFIGDGIKAMFDARM